MRVRSSMFNPQALRPLVSIMIVKSGSKLCKVHLGFDQVKLKLGIYN
jgi:hypothetical protein